MTQKKAAAAQRRERSRHLELVLKAGKRQSGEKAERGRVRLMKAVGRGSGSTELSLSECSSGKGAESRQRRVQSSKDQGPMTMSGLVSRVPATTVVGAPSLRGY